MYLTAIALLTGCALAAEPLPIDDFSGGVQQWRARANVGLRAEQLHGHPCLRADLDFSEASDGWFRKRQLEPEDAGVTSAPLAEVAGGTAAENAAMIESVLAGEPGPRREFVVLNAAAAIVVGSPADNLAEGAKLAREAIDSGAAKAKLEAWREWSRA